MIPFDRRCLPRKILICICSSRRRYIVTCSSSPACVILTLMSLVMCHLAYCTSRLFAVHFLLDPHYRWPHCALWHACLSVRPSVRLTSSSQQSIVLRLSHYELLTKKSVISETQNLELRVHRIISFPHFTPS